MAGALSESARALWARMDAIERFAADVAHEIKNPLSSIRSAIETLRRIEDATKQRRLLAIIAEDVGRLDRLINDISDASRVDAELSRMETEPVDVAPILATLAEIDEATRDERRSQHRSHAVRRQRGRAGSRGAARAGAAQPDRQRAELQPARWPHHRCARRRPARWSRSASRTRAPGIPEAKLEHIFDRFYSERPKGERFGQHSGLGLSISRQIVEALKGRISAENRRDDNGRVIGARFVVRLPKA